MKVKPKVGDRVRLNARGQRALRANGNTKIMRITYVGEESLTEPEETYIVKVDDPYVNQFFIDHTMFESVGAHESV